MRTEAKPRPTRRIRGAAEPRRPERVLAGLAVSPGIGIGPVAVAAQAPVEVERRELFEDQVPHEIERFDDAVGLSRKQLAKLKARLSILPEEANRELEPLLDAYAQMLGNSRLTRGVRKRITEARINAEAAVCEEAEAIAAVFLAGDDDRAGRQRRADEVREIGRRLLRNLTRTP